MSLESVDDVHGSDGLSPGVLGVGHGVLDDALQEALEDLSGVVVDEGRDSLDSSSAGQSADCGLGDALNGGLVAPLLGDSLCADLALSSDTFSTFSLSSSSHSNS